MTYVSTIIASSRFNNIYYNVHIDDKCFYKTKFEDAIHFLSYEFQIIVHLCKRFINNVMLVSAVDSLRYNKINA